MALNDWFLLIHPTIAIVTVLPLLGIVLYQARLTRMRRLSTQAGQSSPIPATSGAAHVQIGRWLSMTVVIVAVLGLSQPIFSKLLPEVGSQSPLRVVELALIVLFTVGSLICLDRATTPIWRGTFATLTGMGLSILGLQPEIFRRDAEWYQSHYYFGMLAAMLMIFSLTIVQNIYRDRSNRWRNVHIILNSFAVLLFIGQAVTGTRDLLEIPPNWQKPYIQSLYKHACQTQACTVAPPIAPP
jgi:Protein of unknown function (DUF4079)